MPSNSKTPRDRADLSRLELDVMNVVWDLGECSTTEVVEAFQHKRDLAQTTIRTVLTNIRKKGYIELVPTIERGFRLRPTVSREVEGNRLLKGLVTSLFKGSPKHAISYLLKNEKIDEAELEEIARMLRERKKQRKS